MCLWVYLAGLCIVFPRYGICQLGTAAPSFLASKKDQINITDSTEDPYIKPYYFNSSLETYEVHINPFDNNILQISITYDNVYMWAESNDLLLFAGNKTGQATASGFPLNRNKVELSPRATTVRLYLDNTPDMSRTSIVNITIRRNKVNSSTENKLEFGKGQLYDFSKMNGSSAVTYSLVNATAGGRLIVFFVCDDSRLNSFIGSLEGDPHEHQTDYCARVLFYQDSTYSGSLLGYSNLLGQPIMTYNISSLTVYQNTWPDMFVQIYFHATTADPRYFSQYRIAVNDLYSHLYVETTERIIASQVYYAVEVRFVKLQENNAKFINYVYLNRTAQLLVYEGVAEIKGYSFPTTNLVATITQTGNGNNLQLTAPVYTFVAINDYVYYEISDTNIYVGSTNRAVNANGNAVMLMLYIISFYFVFC